MTFAAIKGSETHCTQITHSHIEVQWKCGIKTVSHLSCALRLSRCHSLCSGTCECSKTMLLSKSARASECVSLTYVLT